MKLSEKSCHFLASTVILNMVRNNRKRMFLHILNMIGINTKGCFYSHSRAVNNSALRQNVRRRTESKCRCSIYQVLLPSPAFPTPSNSFMGGDGWKYHLYFFVVPFLLQTSSSAVLIGWPQQWGLLFFPFLSPLFCNSTLIGDQGAGGL